MNKKVAAEAVTTVKLGIETLFKNPAVTNYSYYIFLSFLID